MFHCAEWCTCRRLFPHSCSEGGQFLRTRFRSQLKTCMYLHDFVIFGVSHGQMCNLHKCKVESWSLKVSQTENGLFTEVWNILCPAVWTLFSYLQYLYSEFSNEKKSFQWLKVVSELCWEKNTHWIQTIIPSRLFYILRLLRISEQECHYKTFYGCTF